MILFRPAACSLRIEHASERLTARGWFVAGTFTITVALWISEHWHGLPAAVVALLPAVVFTATGLLDRTDVNNLQWNILILIAGGIALGAGMQMTGLDQMIVKWLPSGGGVAVALVAILVAVTMALSTFISNTAAANLLLPIGISSASALGAGAAVHVAVSIALAASMSMALPVSTPPNTIAYSTGEITTRDMAMTGAVVGAFAALLIVLFGGPVMRFWAIAR